MLVMLEQLGQECSSVIGLRLLLAVLNWNLAFPGCSLSPNSPVRMKARIVSFDSGD